MTTVLTGANGGTFPNQCVGPAAGEAVTAASVNNGLQGVLNECKFLYDTKAALAGATFTGMCTFNAGLTASVSLTVTGTLYTSGRVCRQGMVYLGDADHTIDTDGASVYQLARTVSTTRVITLKTTTAPVPLEGEEILLCGYPANGSGPPAGSYNYNIKREDGTHIGAMYGAGPWMLCRFQGGIWRGVMHSGGDPASPTKGAVVPGAGW